MIKNNIMQYNDTYSIVYNIGSGIQRFYIVATRESKDGTTYDSFFTFEPYKAEFVEGYYEDGTRMPKPKKEPFVTKKIYTSIIKEFEKEILSEDETLEAFNKHNAYTFNEIKQSLGLTTETEGEDKKMEQLEMKNFMSMVLEQQKELLKNIKVENPYEDAIVDAIIEKGKKISTDDITESVKGKLDEFIKENYGALPKKIQVDTPNYNTKEMEGIFHEKFEHIVKLITANIPTLLVGPAGSGKNHTLEQAAEALGLDFYFSNAITQEFKLTGFIDANGRYHETQFYKAFKNGGLFFLDEVDASIPEVLIILNSAIANRYFDFPTGRVQAHEDFRVVAAGNTTGTGADSLYVGRSQLDAATIDRFAQVEFGYDENVEAQLASNTDLYSFIKTVRDALAKNSMQYTVSMRSIINASKIDGVMDDLFAVKSIILKTIPTDELRMITDDLPKNNRYTKATLELIEQGINLV